jgi:hypothetical protein
VEISWQKTSAGICGLVCFKLVAAPGTYFNSIIVLLFNLQKPSGFVTYRQVYNSVILHRVRFAFIVLYRSQNRQWLLLYISLTLRLLMSYILYVEHLFLMFLDHTQRRTTVGRTPLDE